MTRTPPPRVSASWHRAPLRRLLPPLVFLAGLCLMIACFYDTGYSSLQPTGKRYETAKADLERLRLDSRRSGQRAPWQTLAEKFRRIYEADPAWPNRPAALFRAAEALDELARRSFAKADARKAVECYEAVAQRHAESRLADDALLRAAHLRAAWLKDENGALSLLRRIRTQYPKGDMASEALRLERVLLAAAKGKTAKAAAGAPAPTSAPPVRPDLALLDGSLMARAAAKPPLAETGLRSRYQEAKARLQSLDADKFRSSQRQPWEDLAIEFLRIYQARKNWPVAPGALYRAAFSMENLAERSGLKKDFRQARDTYLAIAREFPQSALADDALLRAARLDADRLGQPREALDLLDGIAARYPHADMAAPARKLRADLAGEPSPAGKRAAVSNDGPRLVSGMARQLGMTVGTVFIDAGHGGRDPGTSHHGVVERDISLDVALALGRILQANGMEVVYSRSRNATVALRERTAMANSAGTDIFVSIHVNASTNAASRGFETYYLDFARNPQAARVATLENAVSGQRLGNMQKMLAEVMLNARREESRTLARDIQRKALARLRQGSGDVRDNGVKSAPFLVLIGAQMPAVLVEVGYCTHPGEARNLLNPGYRARVAKGIAEGILAYKDRLLKNRTVRNSLTGNAADAI